MAKSRNNKTTASETKQRDDNRVYVAMSEYVLDLDIMKGSQVVLAYIIGLSNRQNKSGKGHYVYAKTTTIANQLNMTLRSVQGYIKELVDLKLLSVRYSGKKRTFKPSNFDADAKAIITDDIMKKDWSIAYKIAHGYLVVKGLKTPTHAYEWQSMDELAEYMGVSRATAYRYIAFFDAHKVLERLGRYNFKCLDRYSREHHDLVDKAQADNIMMREKILADWQAMDMANDASGRPDKGRQVLDAIFNKAKNKKVKSTAEQMRDKWSDFINN